MTQPVGLVEVFLAPGDLHFGDRNTRIRTLLGSCVAITLWHPADLIGGMCHYVMPTRHGHGPRPTPGADQPQDLSGYYADEALAILLGRIDAAGTRPCEYQVKMFGGGNQFPGSTIAVDVAARNIDAGRHLLASYGLQPAAMHLGGTGHRQIVLDVGTGHVWLHHQPRTDVAVPPDIKGLAARPAAGRDPYAT